MRLVTFLLPVLVFSSVPGTAQFTSGDIRALGSPDHTRTHRRFTGRVLAQNGEFYIQDSDGSVSVSVYSTLDAFLMGAGAVRTVSLNGVGDDGPSWIWVNGTIYGSSLTAGGNLNRWNPLTGAQLGSSIPQGSSTLGYGGGQKSIIGCDGIYIYVLRDSTLDIYDLSENLQRTVNMPYPISACSGGFAAGGYFYPVRYPGQSRITDRIQGSTGAISPWVTDLNSGCDYQVSVIFDYWSNRVVHTGGNPSTFCADTTFVYDDVLPPGPHILQVDAAPALVSPGQSGALVTMEVENLAPNILDVNMVDLEMRDSGGLDTSSEYTVTPDPMNPTSIAVGGMETFQFSVDVAPTATLGTMTIDGTIDTTERVTGLARRGVGAGQTDTWDVVGASPQIRVVDAVPSRVAPGASGFVVTFTAQNAGLNGLDVSSAGLTFEDAMGVDLGLEYTVTPDMTNPTTIAIGATESFSFLVDVSPTATLGVVTVDGTIDTVDQVSMAVVSDDAADVPDLWEVLSAVVEIRRVETPATAVSQGGSGYPVSVAVENVGLNGVLVASLAPTFTGSADRNSEYVVTPDPANPQVIGAGQTQTFEFEVAVDALATIEVITLDAAFVGLDTVTGAFVSDVDADVTDSWTVATCGATLCGDCNGDGTLSILDALLAAQHAAGLVMLVATDFTNCNVFGLVEPDPGAVVDVIDALTLAQNSAGLPVMLACC